MLRNTMKPSIGPDRSRPCYPISTLMTTTQLPSALEDAVAVNGGKGVQESSMFPAHRSYLYGEAGLSVS